MRGIRVLIGSCWLLGWASGLIFLGGCTDESRTTGTQVQVSEKQKAIDEDMRNMYKEKAQKKH
jgi:hypothetical protein